MQQSDVKRANLIRLELPQCEKDGVVHEQNFDLSIWDKNNDFIDNNGFCKECIKDNKSDNIEIKKIKDFLLEAFDQTQNITDSYVDDNFEQSQQFSELYTQINEMQNNFYQFEELIQDKLKEITIQGNIYQQLWQDSQKSPHQISSEIIDDLLSEGDYVSLDKLQDALRKYQFISSIQNKRLKFLTQDKFKELLANFCSRLNKKFTSFQVKINSFQNEEDDDDDEKYKELMKQNKQYQQQLKTQDQEIQELNKQLNQQKEKIQMVQEAIKTQENGEVNIKKINQENDELNKQIKNLEGQLKQVKYEKSLLQQEMENQNTAGQQQVRTTDDSKLLIDLQEQQRINRNQALTNNKQKIQIEDLQYQLGEKQRELKTYMIKYEKFYRSKSEEVEQLIAQNENLMVAMNQLRDDSLVSAKVKQFEQVYDLDQIILSLVIQQVNSKKFLQIEQESKYIQMESQNQLNQFIISKLQNYKDVLDENFRNKLKEEMEKYKIKMQMYYSKKGTNQPSMSLDRKQPQDLSNLTNKLNEHLKQIHPLQILEIKNLEQPKSGKKFTKLNNDSVSDHRKMVNKIYNTNSTKLRTNSTFTTKIDINWEEDAFDNGLPYKQTLYTFSNQDKFLGNTLVNGISGQGIFFLKNDVAYSGQYLDGKCIRLQKIYTQKESELMIKKILNGQEDEKKKTGSQYLTDRPKSQSRSYFAKNDEIQFQQVGKYGRRSFEKNRIIQQQKSQLFFQKQIKHQKQ